MLKWYWQLIIFVIVLGAAWRLSDIIAFVRFHIYWKFRRDRIPFILNNLWKNKGIVEIKGGAETGKTLLIMLLTIHLPGRKWSNVPNVVPGWQKLTLPLLKKHWIGDFEDGAVGLNNVILLDEPWNFFNKENLIRSGLQFNNDLRKILWFMSETSKTHWKIFFVKKLGVEPPKAFALLSANKSITVRTLGLREYCKWMGKKYYFLDAEIIRNDQKSSCEETKYKKVEKNGQKKIQPIITSHLLNSSVISIPVSWEDFNTFDETWNTDKFHKKNRMISVAKKINADGFTEGLKIGLSRRQKIRAEQEAINYFKKHHPANKKRMLYKGYELAREKGLFVPAEEQMIEEENELNKQLESKEITTEEYKEKMEKLMERKKHLAKEFAKRHPDPEQKEPNKLSKKFSNKKGEGKNLLGLEEE